MISTNPENGGSRPVLAQVATKCFRSWQCLELKDGSSWLKEDFTVDCNGSPEYNRIMAITWIGIAIWPLGVLTLYSVLLFSQRHVLYAGNQTALTRAFSFLNSSYEPHLYYWEGACLGGCVPHPTTPRPLWLIILTVRAHRVSALTQRSLDRLVLG